MPALRSFRSRSSILFAGLLAIAGVSAIPAFSTGPAGSTAGSVHGRVVDWEGQERSGIFVTAAPHQPAMAYESSSRSIFGSCKYRKILLVSILPSCVSSDM